VVRALVFQHEKSFSGLHRDDIENAGRYGQDGRCAPPAVISGRNTGSEIRSSGMMLGRQDIAAVIGCAQEH